VSRIGRDHINRKLLWASAPLDAHSGDAIYAYGRRQACTSRNYLLKNGGKKRSSYAPAII
jgi:hypothetical protein